LHIICKPCPRLDTCSFTLFRGTEGERERGREGEKERGRGGERGKGRERKRGRK
jgi:hypothetical protein